MELYLQLSQDQSKSITLTLATAKHHLVNKHNLAGDFHYFEQVNPQSLINSKEIKVQDVKKIFREWLAN